METPFLRPAMLGDRGFARYEFNDERGEPCTLQKSSLATNDCIWLGCERNAPMHMGQPLKPRMHLTREHARELAVALLHFANTGDLPWAATS